LRSNNSLSRLTRHSAFVRMSDMLARRQQRVDDLLYRMAQAHRRNLDGLRRWQESLDVRLRHQDMRVRLGTVRHQLEARTAGLQRESERLLAQKRMRVEDLASALGRAAETILLRRRSYWELLHSSLSGLSPKAILARGYALVFDAAGNLIKEASQLKRGDAVRAQLGRGEFTAAVNSIELDSDTE
jgi:exodeoxyribonuclease VII large subunit